MKDIYTFEIHSLEYDRLLSGKKTVQLVINEPKNKDYAVGNQITFKRNPETLTDEQKEQLANDKLEMEREMVVNNLLYFNDFIEAINTLGKESCGFRPSVAIEKTSDLFLSVGSYEAVEKYGILAIVFENIQK